MVAFVSADAMQLSNVSGYYTYESYSEDGKNVLGALIFLAYIVAALYFSLRVWTIIWRRHLSTRATRSNDRQFRVSVAIFMTLLSFSMLSYNMLSFLVLSYTDWTRRLGVKGNPVSNPTLLWDWMSHATLFEDFARSLVATPARSLWTQLALLQTYEIVTRLYRGTAITFCHIDIQNQSTPPGRLFRQIEAVCISGHTGRLSTSHRCSSCSESSGESRCSKELGMFPRDLPPSYHKALRLITGTLSTWRHPWRHLLYKCLQVTSLGRQSARDQSQSLAIAWWYIPEVVWPHLTQVSLCGLAAIPLCLTDLSNNIALTLYSLTRRYALRQGRPRRPYRSFSDTTRVVHYGSLLSVTKHRKSPFKARSATYKRTEEKYCAFGNHRCSLHGPRLRITFRGGRCKLYAAGAAHKGYAASTIPPGTRPKLNLSGNSIHRRTCGRCH